MPSAWAVVAAEAAALPPVAAGVLSGEVVGSVPKFQSAIVSACAAAAQARQVMTAKPTRARELS
jgi:hypothetical protein